MKDIILFDMDGTLTEPRKKMNSVTKKYLCDLIFKKNYEIGILTGSPLPYVLEQCSVLLNNPIVNEKFYFRGKKIHVFPCNGTQYYIYNGEKLIKKYDCYMNEYLTEEVHQKIIKCIIQLQSAFINNSLSNELYFSGTFIQHRKSCINYCPIGRDSDFENRKLFKKLDIKKDIRFKLIKQLQLMFSNLNIKDIKLSLGGSTSIDIFPFGWDKTFVFNHLPKEKCWFIGDKCQEGGNDHEIYKSLSNKSFEVKNLKQTYEIIKNFLNT